MTTRAQDAHSPPHAPRDLTLDGLRCFAIYCVVIMHTAAGLLQFTGEAARWLMGSIFVAGTFFCVPALLMISGALLLRPLPPEKELSPAAFYKKRLPKLLIPLLAWSFIYYVRNHFTMGISIYVPTFFKRLATVSLEGHLWYMYMLLGVYMLLPFLRAMDLPSRRPLAWWLVGLTFAFHIADFLSMAVWGLTLYHRLEEGFLSVFVGYVILGYLLYSSPVPSRRWTPLFLFLTLAGWAATVTLHYTQAFVHGDAANKYLQQTSPFIMLMTACLFQLCRQLPWQRLSDHWATRLASLSALSYGIYLSHILILQLLKGDIGGLFNGAPFPSLDVTQFPALGLPDWLGVLVLSTATFLVAAVLTALVRKIPVVRGIMP